MVLGGGEEVATGTEVVADGAEGGEKLLGVLRSFEVLERPLSSSCGVVGVFCSVVEPLVWQVKLGNR